MGMLEHSADVLFGEATRRERNAHYVSFCVHARLLYQFYRSSDDNRNFSARDFVTDFEPDRPRELEGKQIRLNEQVFHFGAARTDDTREITIADAKIIHAWLSDARGKFIRSLSTESAAALNAALDREINDPDEKMIYFPGAAGSASSHTNGR
jgi:hypothetical protein